MESFKSPDSKKRSKLDEMMGTSHSKKHKKRSGKVKRSPLRTLKQPKDDDRLSRKKYKKGSKKKKFRDEETKIYSRMEGDSMKFGEEFEDESMNMFNPKSELSVRSTKTHKTPLGRGRGRNKSPLNKMNLGKKFLIVVKMKKMKKIGK